jgi:hypothetical protein
MILQRFWKRVSDEWIGSMAARLLFGAAAALIVIMTVSLHWAIPQNPGPFAKLGFGLGGILGGLSVFFLWSGMWRYWIRRDSSSRFVRRIWFVILLVGFWYGAVAYYLCVYLPSTGARTQERVV